MSDTLKDCIDLLKQIAETQSSKAKLQSAQHYLRALRGNDKRSNK